jgi:tRNA(fMet)-specific endonuclease VapC
MTQSSAALPPAELYLLDTNVVSALIYDPAGGVAQTYRAKLTQPGQFRAAISTVVQCELLYGVTKRPSARLKAAYELVMQHLPVLARRIQK